LCTSVLLLARTFRGPDAAPFLKAFNLIVLAAIIGLSSCAAANATPSSTVAAAALPTAAGHVIACAMGVRRFDRVITSDLPRTQETTRDLLDTMGLQGIQPQSWPEFREMTAGSREALAALTPEAREHALNAFGQARVAAEERSQGGESVEEARARILPALDRLRGEQWNTALIIVHTLVNQVILSEALTGADEIYGHLEQGTGCISILDVGADPKDWVVRAVDVCPDTSNHWSRQSVLDRMPR